MTGPARLIAVLAAGIASLTAVARGEDLAAGVSRDKIEITSNFTGTDVVVFGAIENDLGEALPATEARDVVIVIRSDKPYVATVREKARMGPIWINQKSRRFSGVPGFYFLASTRALKEIAGPDRLEELELGLDKLALGPAPGSIGGPREFREAIVRAKSRGGLYSEHEGGISFLSGSLFRTTVALPANVPTGNLKVLVYVFSRGEVSSSNSMTLYVEKTDIERQLSEMAHGMPVLYGFAAVLLSGLAGFLASLAFRVRN
jgi:uncharacterized protein (TIGR02186 family)